MLLDVAVLAAGFAAFGNELPPFGALLVAFIVGQLGGLIPIPGGIGGVDAGLIGALVLYGRPQSTPRWPLSPTAGCWSPCPR